MVEVPEQFNFFEMYINVVKEELSQSLAFQEKPGEDHEKAIKKLLDSYSVGGLQKADSLDFNNQDLRCAYLFLYSTAHTYMVLEAMNCYDREMNCSHLRMAVERIRCFNPTFNITSIGGGPGSDPVGILSFLHMRGFLERLPTVSVRIIDGYHAWSRPFNNLMKRFDSPFPTKTFFNMQDMLKPLSPQVTKALGETHFLTMVKFLSAIAADTDRFMRTLTTIFNLLPGNALILIIDNSGGPAFKQAMSAAEGAGLVPVYGPFCHHKFQVPRDMEPIIHEAHYGVRAQTSCNISMVILEKCLPYAQPEPYQNVITRRRNMGPVPKRSLLGHPYLLRAVERMASRTRAARPYNFFMPC